MINFAMVSVGQKTYYVQYLRCTIILIEFVDQTFIQEYEFTMTK